MSRVVTLAVPVWNLATMLGESRTAPAASAGMVCVLILTSLEADHFRIAGA